jgi:hypothetical protein
MDYHGNSVFAGVNLSMDEPVGICDPRARESPFTKCVDAACLGKLGACRALILAVALCSGRSHPPWRT